MALLHLNLVDDRTKLKLIHLPRRLLTFCDNAEQAIFLSQIIFWHKLGNNKFGWFYKSAKEWKEEINISPRTLRRDIRRFEAAGFLKTIIAKEFGKRVIHFKLNFNLLLKMLEGADNLAEYVQTIWPNVNNTYLKQGQEIFNAPGYHPPRGYIPITNEDGETRLYPFREQLNR